MNVAVTELLDSTHEWMTLTDLKAYERTVTYTGEKETVDDLLRLRARNGILVAMTLDDLPSTPEEKTRLGNRMRGLGIYMKSQSRKPSGAFLKDTIAFPYHPEKLNCCWETNDEPCC